MGMYRQLRLVLFCLINIMLWATLSSAAFDWGFHPPRLPAGGDLTGEVISVGGHELELKLSSGEPRHLQLSPDCQITLNGLSVGAAALGPIMDGHYVEASVLLSADQVIRVEGFYYCVEAEIGAVSGNRILLRPLNSAGPGFWVLNSAASGVQPPVGSICLVSLDSTGSVKQCQPLVIREENRAS